MGRIIWSLLMITNAIFVIPPMWDYSWTWWRLVFE